MTAILLTANAIAWIALVIVLGTVRQAPRTMWLWETLVRIAFASFMGGLVLLLIFLYSGIPIV
jgi:hypothetical protein